MAIFILQNKLTKYNVQYVKNMFLAKQSKVWGIEIATLKLLARKQARLKNSNGKIKKMRENL